MKDLLTLAIESHGGQARWDAIRTVTAELSIGGALWDLKGKTGILQDARYEADVHVQRATLGRFTATRVVACLYHHASIGFEHQPISSKAYATVELLETLMLILK
jgi:hypothetical protein